MGNENDTLESNSTPASKNSLILLIFLILLVLILIIVSIYLFRDHIPFQSETSQEISLIRDNIDSCVNSVLIDGARLVGLQGGYVSLPDNSFKTDFSSIAYGSYLGQNVLLSESSMEKEIGSYIENTLTICFDKENFADFNISYENPRASVSIHDSSISATVIFSLTVLKQDSKYVLNKKYSAEVPIRLGGIRSAAEDIINEGINNPQYIPISSLLNQEYDISILPYSNETLVYVLTDSQSKINNASYVFRFASRIK